MANFNIDESSTLSAESFQGVVLFEYFDSSFSFSSSLTLGQINNFISKLSMSSSMDTRHDANLALESTIGLLSTDQISVILEFLEVFSLGGTEDIQRLQNLTFLSSIFLESEFDHSVNFAVNLAAAMTLRSLDAYGVPIEEASTMAVTSMFESRYNAVLEHLSTLQASSTEELSASIQMALFSTAEMSSEATQQADMNLGFESILGAMSVFRIGEDVYEGWVLGAENLAYSEYQNYPFSDIATLKGKPYALADDGLYLLEGEQDAGTPIAAALRTGLFDFGSKALKDAKSVYLGYTSDGQLVVKTVTTGRGKKREDWYRLKKSPGGDFDMNRATIQRGLRSTYWQFEICNVNGADFDIDDVTIVYNVLSRRIR